MFIPELLHSLSVFGLFVRHGGTHYVEIMAIQYPRNAACGRRISTTFVWCTRFAYSTFNNMSTTLFLLSVLTNPTIMLAATVSVLVVVHLTAWLFDSKGLHRVPGPPLAKLSSLWYAWVGRTGRINKIIFEQHQKYGTLRHIAFYVSSRKLTGVATHVGKVVRITPNEVSIADVDAFKAIYGFGSKALKSDFYDALVQFGGTPSSFLTRSREDHARKRKFMAHGLSLRSILELEPTIRKYQQQVVGHWDRMCLDAKAGKGGRIGARTWTARDGRVWFDCMPCKWIYFLVEFIFLPF